MGVRVQHGKLFVDFRWRGVRCREFTGFEATAENRRRVQAFYELIRAEIRAGEFDFRRRFPNSPRISRFYPPERTTEPETVGAYLSRWLEERRPFRPDGSLIEDAPIHPTTWYHEKNIILRRLIPTLGEIPLPLLTRDRLDRYRRDLVDRGGRNGRGLTDKTAHNVLGVLRKALNDAIEKGLIERNPVPKVTRSQRRRALYRSNVDPLRAEEVPKFLAIVPRRFHVLYRLWFVTGMRPSEIVALRWEDIDWSRETIVVRRGRTPRMGGVEASPKTGVREVTLHHAPEVVEALRALLRGSIETGRPRYVFANSRGTPFSQEELNREVWHPTLRKLGLRPRGEYAIKDTFVTLALSAGEDPGWVAAQVGTSEAILFRHYRGWMPSIRRDEGHRFAALLRGDLGIEWASSPARAKRSARKPYRKQATPTGFEPVLPA